ncbi:NAD(P)H-binding protein [Nocardioides aurantiacus]|uniref:NAD(P)H-binding protein n=1 Tax=Nocardioides aurantiacus TaxID=86796 RepID=UPI00403FB7EB
MRVLVTGATGYVGSRLVPRLLERDHTVHAAVRREGSADHFPWVDDVELTRFDITEPDLVREAVQGMDAVVYLIHSLDSEDFLTKDREAAELVADACEQAGVGRLVYLSGLVPEGDLSDHLRSRLQVEEVFLGSSVPATVLRAAMVIGAGSTSFEILRRLTKRVPVAPIPTWMRSQLQPVTIEEVTLAVAGALEGEPRDRHYDVGGDDVVGYPELLRVMADVLGVRRPQATVPLVPKALAGRIVAAVTRMDRPTVVSLVDSLSHDLVCGERDAKRELLPDDYRSVPLREALGRSLDDDGAEGTSTAGDSLAGAGTDPA